MGKIRTFLVNSQNSYKAVFFAVILHYVIICAAIIHGIFQSKVYLHLTNTFFDHFLQWDSQWYAAVGQYGYHIPLYAQHAFSKLGNPVPFVPALQATVYFPFVPLVVHVFGIVGAIIATNIAFIVSVALMNCVFRNSMSEKLANWSILAYAVNPALIYLSSLYAETFIVLFTLLFVYGINKGTRLGYILACIAGLCASLTHESGFLVIIFGLRYVRAKKYGMGILFIVSVLAGWVGYLGYLWIRFGQPLVIFQAEKTWSRGWKFPGLSIIWGITQFRSGQPLFGLELLCSIAFLFVTVFYLYGTIYNNKQFFSKGRLNSVSLETTLWTIANVLLCLSTTVLHNPLMSVARLWSVIWPVYGFAWKGRDEHRQIGYKLAVSGIFGVFGYVGALLFTHGYFYQ